MATVTAMFKRQNGLITRAQARETGLSDNQITYRVKRGDWVVVHRGVFAFAGSTPSWTRRLHAVVLAADAVASHRCAAKLWGLESVRRPAIEITIEARRRRPRLSGVIVHRTDQWSVARPSARRGVPVTGIDRTVLDCASVVGPEHLERLAESAIRQRLTSWGRLHRVLVEQGRRGRNGTAAMRRLIEARSDDPVVPLSDFSRLVCALIERHGLPRPRLEHQIRDDHGRFLMQVDLAWPELGCIVELDGLEHHFSRADREADIHKRARVRAQGWRMIEVGWKLYADSPDELVDLIRRFLGQAIARPFPSKSVHTG